LYSPFLRDEVYAVFEVGGVATATSFWDMLLNPFNPDVINFYLVHQGRIVPFGLLVYHGGFWVTTRVALLLDIDILTVYFLLKALILLGSYVGMRRLLHLINKLSTSSKISDSSIVLISQIVSLVFLVGLRTDHSNRSGLMVYPFLTFTALFLALWIPLIVLEIYTRPKLRKLRIFIVPLISIVLAFSYELHYVAVVSTLVSLWLVREKIGYRSFLDGVFLVLGIFLVAFLWNRSLIAQACAVNDCYTGTKISIGPDFPGAALNSFLGSLPSHFIESGDFESRVSRFLQQRLYLAPLISAIVLSVDIGIRSQKVFKSDSSSLQQFCRRAGLLGLSISIFTTLAMSASEFAQSLLTEAVPYRGYVAAWAGLALSSAVGAILLVTKIQSATSKRLAIASAISCLAIYQIPYSVSGTLALHSNGTNRLYAQVHQAFIERDFSISGDTYRCKLLADLGDSRRAIRVTSSSNFNFLELYGKPFCSRIENRALVNDETG
jgi:hypothetical protein